ncbi:hypothetical protein R1flu_008081 [Riccia fluitans]|uniref:Secreted protein n=1 Tax=Riccia fluitans TaxID=41844 RepID=A0ABD1YB00_9MARC
MEKRNEVFPPIVLSLILTLSHWPHAGQRPRGRPLPAVGRSPPCEQPYGGWWLAAAGRPPAPRSRSLAQRPFRSALPVARSVACPLGSGWEGAVSY